MAEGSSSLSVLPKMEEAVNNLYDFRDHYFERNSLDRAIHKAKELEEELRKTIKLLGEHQVETPDRAVFFFLKGKALNVLPEFSNEALESLSRAVKLDPKMVEAWNQLGECYWKKKDVETARNCFNGALNHKKNKYSLRNLSMVLRQIGKTDEERNRAIQQSIEYAKEAIELDIKDGTSWFIMGNAYLAVFFAGSQNPAILKQCLSAYSQAEKDPVANCNPDLHFNRATLYKYQEEYEEALVDYARASALDPTWTEPKEKMEQLVIYLSKIQDLVEKKGKLKPKRLQQLLGAFKPSDLGPYGGGIFQSAKGDKVTLVPVKLDQLDKGLNKEKVILGKVVCNIMLDEPIPFTFALIDSEGTCFAVNIFNIAQGQGVIIGDSVAIPEPFVMYHEFHASDKVIKFPSIRVETPVVMVVNGKKWGLDKQAPTVLSVSAKCE
ncbi:tetratricopeptide repeat protein 5-like [Anneissia japonica]|uniref:tetratricopeptide repeat protein 5-like n=1 Tax=Anneissia japonica TaxID=1529436 RepID=UPI001425B091|nr:tetratricopeptide repeat protein 5-like [Anneissia japonica]